jgi:predicted metal-dependent hydrolase
MANGTFETGTITMGNDSISFTVSRSRRRRRSIAIVMDPMAGLRVMAPSRANLSTIHAALKRHSNWILQRRMALHRSTPVPGVARFKNGGRIAYLGHTYVLHVTHDTTKVRGCRLRPHYLDIIIPDDIVSEESRQHAARLELLLWLKKRAAAKLRQRVELWADRLGLRYQRFVLSSPKRRWGSCSAHNVIRLNWRLIMAPLPLIDYVVVHELCHIAHKNHSPQFWRAVEAAVPDYRQRRRRLKDMSSCLTL